MVKFLKDINFKFSYLQKKTWMNILDITPPSEGQTTPHPASTPPSTTCPGAVTSHWVPGEPSR